MKTNYKISGTALCAVALFFAGCDKETLEQVQPSNNATAVNANVNVGSDKATDAKLERFAKALAKSMTDKEVRKFIKNEANKMFDGDYDILYKTSVEKSVNGEKFSKLLAKQLKAIEKSGSDKEAENTLESFSTEIPLLNISVPVNIESWDEESYIPLVVVIPTDFDEKTTKTVKAYDASGKVTLLSAKGTPNVPVIVVGRNERVNYNTNGTFSFKGNFGNFKEGGTGVNSIAPCGTCDGSGGGGTTSPTPSSYYNCRQDGKTDFIRGIKFQDLGTYEAAILGEPEIYYMVKDPKTNSEITSASGMN